MAYVPKERQMTNVTLPPMTVVAAETVGGPGDEYVLLRANQDQNAKYVMLSDTTYTDGGRISNKLRHVFWLPDVQLKAGDHVAVWTGHGTSGFGTSVPANNVPGKRMYHYYLQLNSSIWNDDKDRATLFFLEQWATSAVHGRSFKRAA